MVPFNPPWSGKPPIEPQDFARKLKLRAAKRSLPDVSAAERWWRELRRIESELHLVRHDISERYQRVVPIQFEEISNTMAHLDEQVRSILDNLSYSVTLGLALAEMIRAKREEP